MTSDEKSTCPGESIRLIKNSFPIVYVCRDVCRRQIVNNQGLTFCFLFYRWEVILVDLEVHGNSG